MKLVARYLKPFVGILLLCLALLFGQAMCDLSLPNLMSDMVNVGIQQSGIEEGAPSALRKEGLDLLSAFASAEDQTVLEEGYYTIEPGSSEAQRLAEEYPLVRDEAICIQRDDLTEEELETLGGAYGRASYTMLLYLQQAGESGELEQAAQSLAQSQYPGGMTGMEGAYPEGEMPQTEGDMMPQARSEEDPTLYETQEPVYGDGTDGYTGEQDPSVTMDMLPDDTAGETGTSQEENAQESAGGSMDFSQGLDSVSMDKLYELLPLLNMVPQESLEEARTQAAASDSMMGSQVGVTMTKLFYEELGVDTHAIQTGYIWMKGLQMLGVALLGVIATVLVGFFSARMAATVGKRLRHDLFSKVESFSSGEFDKFSTASLITRTTNDVQQVQMLITMGVRMICYAPIMGIGGIIFAVGKSVSLSWLIALAVVVLVGFIAVALGVALPKFKALQKLIDRLNLVSRENLSGMMVVRAFGNEGYEERRFDKANRDLMETNRFVQRVMSGLMPGMMFVMNLLSILIVWVGGHAIAESTLQIGDMMAFIQYAMQIIMAFLMIAMIFILVPRASVSAGRIKEVLDAPLSIRDPEKPETIQEPKGLVEFKDVSFRYHNADSDVLEHISFTAKPGETTAFIGATGSGKSTLVNLIPRFYDVTGGQITIDGVDVRNLSQKDLREMIGYVPQKGMLFSGTVASNLQYGKEDASEEELQAALSTAQASDFVNAMEEGVESPIAQGGTNVSGGQRQRLSIARALTRKAPIYIFDDSFSALDFKTDAALRKALAKDTAGATVLIVAQRVSTILHAQQIIVLDQGRMVGKGTHKELLANCPEYREIAESQLQKEELE
ncbi:aBC transporter related [Clostridium sp. CAG:1013]|nr:aBC transporter related [Clostridium sp. CAG:1013]